MWVTWFTAKFPGRFPLEYSSSLQEGIEGLCHVSEMENEHGGSGNAKLEVGSEHEFRVIRLNPGDRKIALSMKEAGASSASS